MVLAIQQDYGRFKKIVRGKIKKNLQKFISQGEMLGKQGKKLVSIPLPRIDIPHFKFTDKQQGGVGQGEGQQGSPIGPGDQDGEGDPKAGNQPGAHVQEVDISLDELAEILGEELELPRIQPKQSDKIVAAKNVYRSLRASGPDSLRHFRKTYKQALKRQIISGQYDPKNPMIIPCREDTRYLSYKPIQKPQTNAVIIYMMDVSGSMGSTQKEIVRIESFWIDTWLRSQYKGLETRYIIHDAAAKEVDQDTFYTTRESGGTIISSAYKLALKMILDDYDPEYWNVYLFHFSDGDNWSGSDTSDCIQIIEKNFFKMANVFCYGQVESEYGSGQFLKDLKAKFPEDTEQLITSQIKNKDEIMDSIKTFLGKGK